MSKSGRWVACAVCVFCSVAAVYSAGMDLQRIKVREVEQKTYVLLTNDSGARFYFEADGSPRADYWFKLILTYTRVNKLNFGLSGNTKSFDEDDHSEISEVDIDVN